jgi:hypothetical protein
MMVVMMRLIGLAEKIDKRADDVKARPAYIQPVESGWGVPYEVVKNQVRARTHEQTCDGNELEAIKGRGSVKFGEIHGKVNYSEASN